MVIASNTVNPIAPPLNTDPKYGLDNKYVLAALDVINRNRDIKIMQDNKNFAVQELFESGFEVQSPTGARKISPKILQQIFWRMANSMKPLDAEIFGSGRPQANQDIVTAGVSTVMERGGFAKSLRDKEGAFQKLIMWGDGFVMFGANPDPFSDFPIAYNPISNSNIYFDSYATGIRSGGVGRKATKCVAVFSMAWGDACELFPGLKKKASPGKIPRDIGFFKELERGFVQTTKLYDLIEIAYSWELNTPSMVVFAGPTCAVLNEFKGKNYPFFKGDMKEPYLPILQFSCIPGTQGFYNHGIGDMFYDLAIIKQQLLNMGVNHISENTDPFTLLNVPKGEASKMFNNMRSAYEMRQAGRRPIIPVEYDTGNPNSGRLELQSLTTPNLINEWEVIFNQLDKEISRLGINLDDTNYGNDVTASQVLAEESNKNAFIQQIMEYNASEFEFAYESAMDMIVKLVSSKDKTPLNLTTEVETNGTVIKADQITLGAVRDELKKFHYFVKINARTGVIPSDVLKQAQTVRVLQSLPPGTPAWNNAMLEYAHLNDVNIQEKDLQMPQQPEQQPQQGQAPQGASAQPLPSQTDRLGVNPYSKTQVPAL